MTNPAAKQAMTAFFQRHAAKKLARTLRKRQSARRCADEFKLLQQRTNYRLKHGIPIDAPPMRARKVKAI